MARGNNKDGLAGRLRDRISLLTPVRTPDGAGGYSVSWNVLATVWAEVQAGGGSERLQQDQRQSRSKYTVTLRYREDMTPGMRVLFDGRTLDILAVLPQDRQRQVLTLIAEEIQQ